jgi:hypothetical protein
MDMFFYFHGEVSCVEWHGSQDPRTGNSGWSPDGDEVLARLFVTWSSGIGKWGNNTGEM